ncbi:voltage-gated potassium channel [Aureococcus anophagefferens]|nr:voltage-gated potassium channel [Aureococcus anophagefferens]
MPRRMDGLHRIFTVIQTVKLLRVVKLSRDAAVSKSQESPLIIRGLGMDPIVFRIAKLVAFFVLVLHYLACGYHFVGRKYGEQHDEDDPGFDLCFDPIDWAHYATAGRATWPGWAQSYYWATMAVLGNYMKPENAARTYYSTAPCRSRCGSIHADHDYLWNASSVTDDALFGDLTETLKLKLALAVKRKFIMSCPLFKALNPYAVINLVAPRAPHRRPDQIIMAEDEHGDTMYFCVRGKLAVTIREKQTKQLIKVAELKTGDYFGEAAIITARRRPLAARHENAEFCKAVESQVKQRDVRNVLSVKLRRFKIKILAFVAFRNPPSQQEFHKRAQAMRAKNPNLSSMSLRGRRAAPRLGPADHGHDVEPRHRAHDRPPRPAGTLGSQRVGPQERSQPKASQARSISRPDAGDDDDDSTRTSTTTTPRSKL